MLKWHFCYFRFFAKALPFLKKGNIIREKNFGEYRTDFFIADYKKIIEVKSIVSLEKSQTIPYVHSERSMKQLQVLNRLLNEGYSIEYLFVAMNPLAEELVFPNEDEEYYNLFIRNIEKGMKCRGVRIKYGKGEFKINHEIPIIFN